MRATPTIAAMAYGASSNTMDLSSFGGGLTGAGLQQTAQFLLQPQNGPVVIPGVEINNMAAQAHAVRPRRLVQVFVVDPHTDVPVEKAMLYKGEQTFTDATDTELYFEIAGQVNDALAKHNTEVRAKTVDKSVKDRTAYLEPARIGDIKMSVLVIVSF